MRTTTQQRPISRTKGRSLPARSATVDAVVIERMKTHRLTRGGLTAMEVTTGALTADQLAQVCGVTPRLIDGWTKAGWLPFQTEDDGTILYATTAIPLIEAMLEIAGLVADDATLRRNVLHLRDQMAGLWSRALFATYFDGALPTAQSEMPVVTLKVDGREVRLTFLQRALVRLRDLSPAA